MVDVITLLLAVTMQTRSQSIDDAHRAEARGLAWRIVQVAYDRVNDPGAITQAGATCFFVDAQIAITCYHVLNENTRAQCPKKNDDLWLMQRGKAIPVKWEAVSFIPKSDIAVIRFEKPIPIKRVSLTKKIPAANEVLYACGYGERDITTVQIQWQNGVPIPSFKPDPVFDETAFDGTVARCAVSNPRFHLSGKSIQIRAGMNVPGRFQQEFDAEGFMLKGVSFPGMSGGPI